MAMFDKPGSTAWIPGRGDYGTDHSSDMIELIEELNCSQGCVLSGTRAARKEFGPGGNCPILLKVSLGDHEPIPELDPREDGPHCRARVPLPPRPDPVHRGPRPPKDIPPLF